MKHSILVLAVVSALGAASAQAMDFGEATGTFIGGVVGGVVGNKMGHGNPMGTLVGSAVGGIIGREIASQPKAAGGYEQIPLPPTVQDQQVYQQQPQVIYQQQPQVIYQQVPQVIYQPAPVVVYQQPRVIYAPGYYYRAPGSTSFYRDQVGRW